MLIKSDSAMHQAIMYDDFRILLFSYFFNIKVIIVFLIYVAFTWAMSAFDEYLLDLRNSLGSTPAGSTTVAENMIWYKLYPAILGIIFIGLIFKVHSSFIQGFMKELMYSANIYHLHDVILFLNANSLGNFDNYKIYEIHQSVVAFIVDCIQLFAHIIIAAKTFKTVVNGKRNSSDGTVSNGIGTIPMSVLLVMLLISSVGYYFINKFFRKPRSNVYKNTYEEITQVAFMINRNNGLKYCKNVLNDRYDQCDFDTKLNELKLSVIGLIWFSICFFTVYCIWEYILTRKVIFGFGTETWLPVKTFVISVFVVLLSISGIFNSLSNFYDDCAVLRSNIRATLPNKSVGKLNYFEIDINKLYVGARKFDGSVDMFNNVDEIKSAILSEDMGKILKMINLIKDIKNRNLLMDIYNECLLFQDVKFKISAKEFLPSFVVNNKLKKTYKIVAYDRLLKYDDKLANDKDMKVVEFGNSLYIKDNRAFYDNKPLSICGFYIKDNRLFDKNGLEIHGGDKLIVKNGSVMSVFVGASGGGKSTIVQYLFGLRSSPQVSNKLNDIPVRDIIVNNFSKYVGCIPQIPMILDHLTVMKNFGCFGATNENRIKQILKDLGIFDVLKLAIDNNTLCSNIYMSGGQRVRFSLAMALAADANPDFLLIDEAISSLSSEAQSELVNLFNTWNKAFVVIEHVGKFVDIANVKVKVGNGCLRYFVRCNGKWMDVFELNNLNKAGDHISCDDAEVYLDYTDGDIVYNVSMKDTKSDISTDGEAKE